MSEQLVAALLRYSDGQVGRSVFETAIEGMYVLRSDFPKPPSHVVFKPAMCIVVQGAKWATFGESRLEYTAGEALVVGIETPSIGRVTEATPSKPCLILALELDVTIMRSVAEGLEAPPTASGDPGRGAFVTEFRGPLADCALRLVRLLDTPSAIPTLYPLIMREICYWLLTGSRGGDVARLTLASGPSQQVIGAMHSLRTRFRETVRIEELAAIAQMSASAFHRHFKTLTSLTPLQYQKQLRLLEARRLLISSHSNVEAASFEVGYESSSQFSREYARFFGVPPKRDAKRLMTVFLQDEDSSVDELMPNHA